MKKEMLINVSQPEECRIAIIEDGLLRIGHLMLPDPIEVVPSPIDGYRTRARLHVRGGRIGFFREGTHALCDPSQTRQLMPATLNGMCLCVAVRYTVADEFAYAANCHCSDCRRATGSASVTISISTTPVRTPPASNWTMRTCRRRFIRAP